MWRYLFLAISAAAIASEVPDILSSLTSQPQQQAQSQSKVQTRPEIARLETPAPARRLTGRKVRIEMNARGQFITTARLNGRGMKVLVDTGATSVAINESTARRIGLRLRRSDFRYNARTANGVTKVALATIDEIQIGRIRIKNVRASIAKDSSLDFVLLGMSFLSQLKKFEVADNTLVLSQ